MRILPLFLLMLAVAGVGPATRLRAEPAADLRAALAREDLAAIRKSVDAVRRQLGTKAGEPEVADRWQLIPPEGSWLTEEEARPGFTPYLSQWEQRVRTWSQEMEAGQMKDPLRAPASVVGGCVAVCRAGLAGAERCEKLAREAADLLCRAQAEAGAGCFPFPASRGASGARAFQAASRFLAKAEAAGRLEEVTRHGWIFDDLGQDGGLQFDNAEAGVAMLELYELTHEPRWLAAARSAADWAAARPLCANWNYNSFSVWLLAKACEVTGEKRYGEAALKKARLGVLPGQMTDGPHAGRWLDPHNARPAYHYIMLRALTQLAVVSTLR